MKKKRITIIVSCFFVIAGCIGWKALSNYSLALEANWGFSLPLKAIYRELYAQDSGPSFHGDGIRYHVYSYGNEDPIGVMFAWEDREQSTIYGETYSQAVTQWLDRIDVPDQWRPDYDKINGGYWYKSHNDNSQIIVIWNPALNRIYIAESFI